MNKLSTVAYGVITLVVVVILIFTIAIPVIEDAQKEQHTAYNNEGGTYVVSNSTKNVTIECDLTDGSVIVDGVDQQSFHGDYEMIWAEKFSCRTRASSGNYYFQGVYDDNSSDTYKSIRYADGIVTLTNVSDQTTSFPSDWIIYPNSAGKYMQFVITDTNKDSIYFNTNASIYVTCLVSTAYGNYVIFEGSPDNMSMYSDFIRYGNAEYTDAELNISTVEGTDANNLKFASTPSITLSAPDDESIEDVTITGNQVVVYVPIEYNAISSNDSMIITLLGIIPLILAIVPVMLAVQLLTGSRRD